MSSSSVMVTVRSTTMSNIDMDVRAVLNRHPEIRLAVLFGSMVTGHAGHDSDVDLAVTRERALVADEKMALMSELAEATGRPIDLIDLCSVGIPLLGQIVKRGRRVLGTDESYAALIRRYLFEEADFMPYYRRILSERRAAWIGK